MMIATPRSNAHAGSTVKWKCYSFIILNKNPGHVFN